MTNSYIDVQILVPLDATELAGLVHQPGFLGVWDSSGVIHLYWNPEQWSEMILSEIQMVVKQLHGCVSEEWVRVHQVPKEDWNATWAASVIPIRIGRQIVIRPSWEHPPFSENSSSSVDLPIPHERPSPLMGKGGGEFLDRPIELILDPKQAFGTGHHATTQLLVEWLEDLVQGSERVLDVGTGSGILAMVALRLGAKFALGIDNDPVAIECAHDYADLNKFGQELDLRVGVLEGINPEPFQLIVANLDGKTLLSCHSDFQRFTQKGSLLLVSGVLEGDQEEILDAFLAQDAWNLLEIREREGWLAMGFRSKR